ncbi:MAG: circularly permuted type 2 ATP-grasp protein, partial [Acidobacteria bacterium]|nr:circularly permuted type 2 ATP-grasp protein [Acidobacteriota bacterium]
MTFDGYDTEGLYDEMFLPDGTPRAEARLLVERIEALPDGELVRRHQAAERALLNTGITFTVYGDDQGTERIFPFDIVPRIVPGAAWDPIERGLKQRIQALNLFLDDVYHDRRIVRDGVVPGDVVDSSQGFRPQCVGLDPPGGVWCHITGTDL